MFKGAGVAILTPFKNGQVDLEAYGKLVDFQLEKGIQCLVVLGTTGEASTLNETEREDMVQLTVNKAKGKVPVIVGAGSNNTAIAVKYAKQAEALGADGVLVVTPYYNKATQNGLVAHFTAVAEAVDVPVVLYNVPSRTGVNIEPATVARLAEVKNIVGIKEASGNISQVLEIKRLVPADFMIWSGNDDNILPIYSVGGHGVISVMANMIPGETQAMCEAFMAGRIEEAIQLQVKTKKLFNLLFMEVNPIPIKAALYLMGMMANELRLPLTPMEPDNMEQLKQEMIRLNIIQ
ncbi:4-hydroxy-tetrahydrodipicolinate synthase [Anoxynatronum buryatiense]|uniref:4-hydroxy-tetrahydrodipicolinate synthase n=1 Tax=Anoxynatronum buryatiense TaxID=489973 RepID=A0AA45WT34_9CLOT|nr:4-hydroxy-tetrahydrodipicolinate synthase [Anoxynatronum buryatiense]SMP40441.1 4-hydroxy-tetrahydrodipicolinate synthase [Anoxynatronum buryatiense]